MTRARRSAFVAAVLLLAAPAAGDIDVTVPAGTPGDWAGRSRVPTPNERGTIPTPRAPVEEDDGGRSVVSVERRTEVGPGYGLESTFGYSGITTVDLPSHLPWTVPQTTTPVRPGVVVTGEGPGEVAYPPDVPEPLYWLAVAHMLRAAIHPGKTSESELVEYLIELGFPSRLAADSARAEPALRGLSEKILRSTENLPREAPRPVPGATPEETMLRRFALQELVSGYPHSPGGSFASRILSLGNEAVNHILPYARSDHDFARQNAVALLAAARDRRALPALVDALGSRDPVTRNRALTGLAALRDLEAARAILARIARGGDESFLVYAIAALGRAGSADAVDPILRATRSHRSDFDYLWAGLAALVRLGAREPAVQEFFVSQKRSLAAGGGEKVRTPGPNFMPPEADPPDDRHRAALQMVLAGLALGDPATHAAELLALLGEDAGADPRLKDLEDRYYDAYRRNYPEAEARRMARDMARRALGRFDSGGAVLAGIHPAARFLVIEVLPRIGEKGIEALVSVADDPGEDPRLREEALRRIPTPGAGWLDGLAASTSVPSNVRILALARLAPLEPETAGKRAVAILAAYADGTPNFRGTIEDHAVIGALVLSGDLGVSDAALLRKALQRALREEKDAAAERDRMAKELAAQQGIQRLMAAQETVIALPPVLAYVLREIGRARDETSAIRLREILVAKEGPGRPEAAMALGAIGTAEARQALLAGLAVEDGWVRFLCYRALRAGTGQDFFADWIYGTESARGGAARKYEEWLAANPAGPGPEGPGEEPGPEKAEEPRPDPKRTPPEPERPNVPPLPAGWLREEAGERGIHRATNPIDGSLFLWVPPDGRGEGGFWIGRHEVSRGRYRDFAAAEGRELPELPTWAEASDDLPAIGVTYDEAQSYARWCGARLPTTAEWERAARWDPATDGWRDFPWGDELPEPGEGARANGDFGQEGADGHAHLAPVDSYPAGDSAIGARQMVGNVWEWCVDPAADPADGLATLLGGSWASPPDLLSPQARLRLGRQDRSVVVGFRLAR